MPLDLENGDEELANATPAERRRIIRKRAREEAGESPAPAKKPASRRSSESARERIESELASRLDRTFDRIALALDARGDEELARTVRDDAGAMGQGLVSLTRSVKPLRGPLLMMLNLVEPVLAFGRVGRILYVRYMERRFRMAEERQGEAEPSPVAATA